MPNWISLTLETLYEARVAALVDACDSIALGDNQVNRSAGLIAGVVAEIRNAVASNANNLVDADAAKIPANLRDLAVDLIIARLKGALEQRLTEDESRTVEWRRRQLRELADGTLTVDQPDLPIMPTVQATGSVETILPRDRVATRTQTSGLL